VPKSPTSGLHGTNRRAELLGPIGQDGLATDRHIWRIQPPSRYRARRRRDLPSLQPADRDDDPPERRTRTRLLGTGAFGVCGQSRRQWVALVALRKRRTGG